MLVVRQWSVDLSTAAQGNGWVSYKLGQVLGFPQQLIVPD